MDQNTPLSIYPNPATNVLKLSLENGFSKNTGLEIFDETGKLVMSKQLQNLDFKGIIQLDITSLSNGRYFVRLTDSTGFVTKNFVVAR